MNDVEFRAWCRAENLRNGPDVELRAAKLGDLPYDDEQHDQRPLAYVMKLLKSKGRKGFQTYVREILSVGGANKPDNLFWSPHVDQLTGANKKDKLIKHPLKEEFWAFTNSRHPDCEEYWENIFHAGMNGLLLFVFVPPPLYIVVRSFFLL